VALSTCRDPYTRRFCGSGIQHKSFTGVRRHGVQAAPANMELRDRSRPLLVAMPRRRLSFEKDVNFPRVVKT